MIRRILNGLLLVGILAVAGVVLHTTPTDDQRDAPIYVSGAIGDRLEGRNIAGSVNSVSLADQVTTSRGWVGETEGVWVIADVSMEAVTQESGSLLYSWLVIGDTRYSASSRPDLGTVDGQSLSVGIPMGGPVMFEIPATSADASARLEFAETGDPRDDSVLSVPVALGSLHTTASIDTDDPTWGTQ